MSGVLIVGESGSGKSTSMRNLDPEKTMLIQVVKKDLPFRPKGWLPLKIDKDGRRTGNIIVTRESKDIVRAISKAKELGFEIVVIDDFQYLMSYELFERATETGYGKFTEMAIHAKNVLDAAREAEGVNVYVLTHVEMKDGVLKMKTVGKMLDEKLTPEGLMTIVLRAISSDGKHYFTTKNADDTVKTPMGMFKEPKIDNDLAQVDKTIREYYS